jgi:hypothetical protein
MFLRVRQGQLFHCEAISEPGCQISSKLSLHARDRCEKLPQEETAT